MCYAKSNFYVFAAAVVLVVVFVAIVVAGVVATVAVAAAVVAAVAAVIAVAVVVAVAAIAVVDSAVVEPCQLFQAGWLVIPCLPVFLCEPNYLKGGTPNYFISHGILTYKKKTDRMSYGESSCTIRFDHEWP